MNLLKLAIMELISPLIGGNLRALALGWAAECAKMTPIFAVFYALMRSMPIVGQKRTYEKWHEWGSCKDPVPKKQRKNSRGCA